MRGTLGIIVLGLGVVGLGLWARASHAPRIEAQISAAVAPVAASGLHGVTAQVSGRDITLSGLADGVAERDRLIRAATGLPGRRVVRDDLTVLPTVQPFTLAAQWADQRHAATGHVPTESGRAELAGILGTAGAQDLVLAAGAPDGHWARAVATTLAAMTGLENARLSVVDRAMTLTCLARTPVEGAALTQALAALPDGYSVDMTLDFLDDGSPADYRIIWGLTDGATLTGKLPLGLTAGDLSAALGIEMQDSTRAALFGRTDTALGLFEKLRGWLGLVERFDATATEAGLVLHAGVGVGSDVELITAALAEDLGAGAQVTVEIVPASGADGDTRVNPLTGAPEMLRNGFWLPVVDFTPDRAGCEAEAARALAENRINFVTGGARLDARAQRAVNALAFVMLECTEKAGLRAEVAGHTDSTGSPVANMRLSRERAQAVVAALQARGLPAQAMIAEGYGITQPIAENDTEEGRAANRRTTVTWLD
jgi:outer membrane protein OmpA-like peptidoglycan-associated protein